jgi:nicotinic acid phosphoribosyltransferase
VDCGPEIEGLDFVVDGLGQFENITHADTKNGVDSVIKIAENQGPNIRKQGRKIGKKSVWQKKFWSNKTRTSELLNIIMTLIYLNQ